MPVRLAMSRAPFDAAAIRYEAWYRTRAGRRASRGERRLVGRSLDLLPRRELILEIGCGTGHFTRWLADTESSVIGLDRSAAMLAQAHQLSPELRLVQGDALRLPLSDCCVDVSVFITTLEFVDAPAAALAEAVRVARTGVIVVALNRWGSGAFSRRWGRAARGELLSQARDFTLPALRSLLRGAAAERLRQLWWSSAVFPAAPAGCLARLPLGSVLGVVAVLSAGSEAER
jgi:ubiquinone/menaquinone biosynthesis C-methylase UbiE